MRVKEAVAAVDGEAAVVALAEAADEAGSAVVGVDEATGVVVGGVEVSYMMVGLTEILES